MNVADFDVVVLDFTAFSEDPGYAEQVSADALPPRPQFAHLLFGRQSSVIAIGDPRVAVAKELINMGGSAQIDAPPPETREIKRFATWWLPLTPGIEAIRGEQIKVDNERWEFWFEHVTRYDWCFQGRWHAGSVPAHEYIGSALSGSVGGFKPHLAPLASTRFAKAVGAMFRLEALDQNPHRSSISNEVIWVPPCTDLPADEAVALLLAKLFGLDGSQSKPQWIGDFTLPRHDEARQKREEAEGLLLAAEGAVAEARAREAREARWQGLLYASGSELERLVWEALRELGATVTEPVDTSADDGRLRDPRGRQAMLEVKGVAGPVGLGHVRQLTGWMQDAQALEEWEGKGLLIANAQNLSPPAERRDTIADNARRFAERQGVSIVSTSALFEALQKHQQGDLDALSWWDALFASKGGGLPSAEGGGA